MFFLCAIPVFSQGIDRVPFSNVGNSWTSQQGNKLEDFGFSFKITSIEEYNVTPIFILQIFVYLLADSVNSHIQFPLKRLISFPSEILSFVPWSVFEKTFEHYFSCSLRERITLQSWEIRRIYLQTQYQNTLLCLKVLYYRKGVELFEILEVTNLIISKYLWV